MTAAPQQLANAIRALSMDAVQAANSGHPGMPMGMADVATTLFTRYLKFDPQQPRWADRDRFVLSAGHGSMLAYATLHLTGYARPTMDDIRNFRQLHSPCAGHPENFELEGVESTTGPLGQGLAMAVGMAIAERHLNAVFGDELVDHRTWVIAGDGCLMEGINHEAIGLAGHLGLGRSHMARARGAKERGPAMRGTKLRSGCRLSGRRPDHTEQGERTLWIPTIRFRL